MKQLYINIQGVSGHDSSMVIGERTALEHITKQIPELVCPDTDELIKHRMATGLYQGPHRALQQIDQIEPDVIIMIWNDVPNDVHQAYADVVTEYGLIKGKQVLTVRKIARAGQFDVKFVKKEDGTEKSKKFFFEIPALSVIDRISVCRLASIRTVFLNEHIPFHSPVEGPEHIMAFKQTVQLKGLQYLSMYGVKSRFTEEDEIVISGHFDKTTKEITFDKPCKSTLGFELFTE